MTTEPVVDRIAYARESDLQALADVRTLDEWAKAVNGRQVWLRNFHDGGVGHHEGWSVQMVEELAAGFHVTGSNADEARARAAAWVREGKK